MADWSEFASPSVVLLLARSAAPQVKAITNGRCANVPSPLWLDDKLGGLRPRMPGGASISNFGRRVFELRNYCWWLRGLRESISGQTQPDKRLGKAARDRLRISFVEQVQPEVDQTVNARAHANSAPMPI